MPNLHQTISAVYAYSGLDGIDYTPGSAVQPGTVVSLGNNFWGISRQLIPANVTGTLAIVGVFDLLLAGSTPVNVGVPVYWHVGNGNAQTSSISNAQIGICVQAASSNDNTVRVLINPGIY